MSPSPAVHVLLVEDNDGDALLVREALEDAMSLEDGPPRLSRVADLASGIDWLAEDHPCDCVLLDLGLPDASEMQALDRVLDAAPWVPVVVLTGDDDPTRVARALARGAQDWLVKSSQLSPEVLGRTIRHAVQRGRAYAEVGHSRDELARFAQTVAHDIKGPIGAITGYLDLITRMLDDGDVADARELMGRTRMAALRLAELTDGLLTYAEVPVDETLATVDLTAVARWVQDLVAPSLGEVGGTMEVGALPAVRGHEAGLRQVLLNLVTNAVKYRDPDRALRIDVSASTNADGLAEVVVSDTGTGIPPEDREHVFEPGARGAGSGSPGLGLGLAAVRRVVERHRGRIWVGDPPPGGGTAVHLTLVPASH